MLYCGNCGKPIQGYDKKVALAHMAGDCDGFCQHGEFRIPGAAYSSWWQCSCCGVQVVAHGACLSCSGTSAPVVAH